MYYTVREMMFGSSEEFEYLECGTCGCLQLLSIPEDISKYYPANYNAYEKVRKINDLKFKRFLKLVLTEYCLFSKNKMIGYILSKFFSCGFLDKIKDIDLNLNSEILDVGSGNGYRLIGLIRHGFTNITGIDPFIERDIFYNNGLKILKKNLNEVKHQSDFIMLNHSFEHMPDPLNVMLKLNSLIKRGKYVLIRIPIAGSYSWKKYGVNWVALDAPRHFFLHTPKSMEVLTQKTGFEIRKIIFDSTEYQFWGSEQYLKGIPMRDKQSYYENPKKSIFNRRIIKKFKKQAVKLNKAGQGDAACFYLYKP